MLASPVPTDAVVSMRLSALVVDLAVLGPQAWAWLERLCGALPELGIVVCTGPSTVAQRVRGLRLGADDWITKPCHPEEVIARVQSVVRRRRRTMDRAADQADDRRRGRNPLRSLPGVRRRAQHRPDQARVRADRAARRRRGAGAGARGHLLAACGAMRWCAATARSTCSCASCARSSRRPRRSGATSTPTSASATASPPKPIEVGDVEVPSSASRRLGRRRSGQARGDA